MCMRGQQTEQRDKVGRTVPVSRHSSDSLGDQISRLQLGVERAFTARTYFSTAYIKRDTIGGGKEKAEKARLKWSRSQRER
jgi:hypothetical protein